MADSRGGSSAWCLSATVCTNTRGRTQRRRRRRRWNAFGKSIVAYRQDIVKDNKQQNWKRKTGEGTTLNETRARSGGKWKAIGFTQRVLCASESGRILRKISLGSVIHLESLIEECYNGAGGVEKIYVGGHIFLGGIIIFRSFGSILKSFG